MKVSSDPPSPPPPPPPPPWPVVKWDENESRLALTRVSQTFPLVCPETALSSTHSCILVQIWSNCWNFNILRVVARWDWVVEKYRVILILQHSSASRSRFSLAYNIRALQITHGTRLWISLHGRAAAYKVILPFLAWQPAYFTDYFKAETCFSTVKKM